MIAALAADFAAIDGCQRDRAARHAAGRSCRCPAARSSRSIRRPIGARSSTDSPRRPTARWSWRRSSTASCATLSAGRDAGGRSLNATDEFIAIASDKHRTAERLRAAGVPVAAAVAARRGRAKLPADFAYPAVLKPLDGAGSQHMLLVHGAGDEPPPYPWPRRLEQFCPGRPASVAAICAAPRAVPCCRRVGSNCRRRPFTYRGGRHRFARSSLAARATALALRALDALPRRAWLRRRRSGARQRARRRRRRGHRSQPAADDLVRRTAGGGARRIWRKAMIDRGARARDVRVTSRDAVGRIFGRRQRVAAGVAMTHPVALSILAAPI